MFRITVVASLLLVSGLALGHGDHKDEALHHAVEQLRTSVGRWQVVTDFLNEDGSLARSVSGSYEFSWVVPDRVLSGHSEMPELKQTVGILFYIKPAERQIEMVSVGADGRLWVMTGPLGGEQRLSQQFDTADGGTGQLRFTRFKVTADAFESKMDYTGDGGLTWNPGHHQRFRRVGP